MSLASEFKAFVMRGNVLDLAVGVVIGAAFGKIVSSLVADLLMPPIGLILGGVNFSDLAITLRDAVPPAVPVKLAYGKFIQSIVDFLIIAFAIFMVVKGANRLQREKAAAPAPPEPTPTEKLLTDIRDLLKRR